MELANTYPSRDVIASADHRHRLGGVIQSVAPGSLADAAGVRPGDRLVALDGRPVTDLLDYRFRTSGESVVALFHLQDGRTLEVPKSADEGLGIDFADEVFDRVRICKNNCPFCFIYQLPKGMRRSLYVKDDDYRLSFAHGNYVTLTNLSEADFRRIEEQRLSPMYVSVHATDPEVRARLLGIASRNGSRAVDPDIMGPLRRLARARIQVHCQIVLCPGINDGDVLVRTLLDLASLHPCTQSVAVVPVAVGKHMPPKRMLAHLTKADAARALATMAPLQRQFLRLLGTRFAFAADELYLLAEAPIPGHRHYEGFPQLEDGIGITRLFQHRWAHAKRKLPIRLPAPRWVAFATAELGAKTLGNVVARLNAIGNLHVDMVVVHNSLFGERISVAGLMMGADVANALANWRTRAAAEPAEAWVPAVALRDGRFLDDLTPADVEARSGVPVRVVAPWPRGMLEALSAEPLS